MFKQSKTYCPDFRDQDIMVGGFDSKYKKYSWLRMAMHRCDPKKNKCASR